MRERERLKLIADFFLNLKKLVLIKSLNLRIRPSKCICSEN